MGRDCSCAGANETIVVGRGRRADVRLAHGLTAATIAPGKTVAVPSVLQLSTLGLRPANASTASPQNASTPKTFGVDSANGITVNIHDKEDHSPEKSPKHGAKCFPEHGLTKGTKMIASEAAVDFTVPNAGTTIPGGCIGVLYQILKREVMCFCPRTKETAHYSIEKREIFAVNPQSGKAAETDWHTTQTKYCESTPNADEACDLLTEDKCDVTLKSMTPKELANAAITMAYTDFGDYANSVGADGAQVANIDRRGRNFSLLDSKPTLKDSSGKEIKATYHIKWFPSHCGAPPLSTVRPDTPKGFGVTPIPPEKLKPPGTPTPGGSPTPGGGSQKSERASVVGPSMDAQRALPWELQAPGTGATPTSSGQTTRAGGREHD